MQTLYPMLTFNRQKGFATLFVVIVLLTAMTTITVIMTRSGMLAQSINQNESYTQEAQLAAENALEYQIAWLSTQKAQDALVGDGIVECPKDASDCPTLPTLKGKDQSEFALKLTFKNPKYIKITIDAKQIATNSKASSSCTVEISGPPDPTGAYKAVCAQDTIVSDPTVPSPALQAALKDSLDTHIKWLKTNRDTISLGSPLVCIFEPSSIQGGPTAGLNPICPIPTLPPPSILSPPPIDLTVKLEALPPFIALTAEATQSNNHSKATTSCLVKLSGTTAPYQVARIPGTWKDWE